MAEVNPTTSRDVATRDQPARDTARDRDNREGAAKTLLSKQVEARKASQEKAVKSMEGVQPTPTQEENDLAKMGVDVPDKEPDGSPVEGEPAEPPPEGTPVSRTGGAYATRQSTPAPAKPVDKDKS